ncbi:sulfite exporter TauE/SafE family protein [Amycolatopsis orientalis]|uniref:sulfite exporter TauE/SafE family protein n=1 Tax=Amycolatopsis orientalis TaxID=31958 RepID=UPI0003A78709|nr:sulfite exporter TauE/SafE family protein [Amycolatopsis orientalis]
MTFWQLSPAAMAFAVAALLAGGLIRGYSGFGASLVWVSCLCLVLPPPAVIPSTLLLEIASSVSLLPKSWPDANRPSIRWLLAGALLGLPIGIWFLAALPERATRLTVGLVVGISALALALSHRTHRLPGRPACAGMGTAFGVLNGACGMGGPPVVLMYLASPLPMAVNRASLVVFFLAADSMTVATAGTGGLLSSEVLLQTALFLPVALAGVAAGTWLYRHARGDVRRIVLGILAVLSLALVGQAVVA